MNFANTKRRQNKENIIPMINVVFLLLIFFLMTAEISPPDQFEVNLPIAKQDLEPSGDIIVYFSKDARVGFQGMTGPDALKALNDESDKTLTLKLHADAETSGLSVAQTLKTFTELGFKNVEIIVGGG